MAHCHFRIWRGILFGKSEPWLKFWKDKEVPAQHPLGTPVAHFMLGNVLYAKTGLLSSLRD